MKKIKTAAVALIAILLLGTAVITAKMEPAPTAAVTQPSLGRLSNGPNLLAARDNLVLAYDTTERMFYIEDIISGKTWQSGATRELFDFEAAGIADTTWERNYRSLFSFVYADIDNSRSSPQPVFSESESAQVIADKIQDGARLTYNFARIGITVVVEVFLQDGRMVARIPADGIIESGSNVILTIDMLPFMGASDRFNEGYILVPVGSGGLVRFDAFLSRADVSPMEFGIYGRKYVWPWDYINNSATELGYYEALLPLYGVRIGNEGYLAVAENGSFDASISITPGSDTLPLTNACFRFTQRYQFEVMLSNLSGGSATFVTKTDQTRIERDCTVSFEFLSGSDATYSGMARHYRSRLLERGILQNASLDGELPLGVEFFMGAQEQRPLGAVYIPMTTYEQAAEIVERLLALGVGRMDVSLNSWAADGYGAYPSSLKPEYDLGGRRGFTEFSSLLAEKSIPLYARVNYVRADGNNGGFSQRNDVVLGGNGIQNSRYDMYILRASAGRRLFNRGLKSFSRLGTGVMFEQVGLYLYHDYDRSGTLFPRSDTAQDMKALLETAANAGLPLAMEGANQYLLPSVSRIYDMPIGNGGYALFDETVPFLSMVLHGAIPYTANPGNLFYNEAMQVLTWVEFGAMPFYQLTHEHPQELKYTDANWLFSGMAEDWTERIAARYTDMKDRLGMLWGRQMLSHSRPAPGVVCSEYDGGHTVYVNYNDRDVTVDGIVIPALDFKVVST